MNKPTIITVFIAGFLACFVTQGSQYLVKDLFSRWQTNHKVMQGSSSFTSYKPQSKPAKQFLLAEYKKNKELHQTITWNKVKYLVR